jgi:hypothetical protein
LVWFYRNIYGYFAEHFAPENSPPTAVMLHLMLRGKYLILFVSN